MNGPLNSVHTELLAIVSALAKQKWVENFAKEWVEYPSFLAMPANANSIANAQGEPILTLCLCPTENHLTSLTISLSPFLDMNVTILS